MKVIILAGGFGTRLSEETITKPKPMVEIGGKPILWHIMKIYSYYGFNDFIICLGYKGEVIKEYFANYFLRMSDVTINLKTNEIKVHKNTSEDWKVTLIDTGLTTMTGGRIKRVEEYIEGTFMVTYGDGVADINIKKLVEFHRSHGKIGTVTAVRPTGRFGALYIEKEKVKKFTEKPQEGEGWINGGFFIFEKAFFKYIKGDESILEREPLENLAKDGELMSYKHYGFWQCMDTLRDKNYLEKLYQSSNAPWIVWDK